MCQVQCKVPQVQTCEVAIPFPICFSDNEVKLLELKSHQAT